MCCLPFSPWSRQSPACVAAILAQFSGLCLRATNTRPATFAAMATMVKAASRKTPQSASARLTLAALTDLTC